MKKRGLEATRCSVLEVTQFTVSAQIKDFLTNQRRRKSSLLFGAVRLGTFSDDPNSARVLFPSQNGG